MILHLFMRQTPKHVIFPALRLVRERQKRSQEAAADQELAAPAGADGPAGPDGPGPGAAAALLADAAGRRVVPTALGLVFDTSLSMGYKEKDKTRLDEAKERAREILKKIPDSSQVFVVDSADPGVPAGAVAGGGPEADRRADASARSNRPLNAAMGQAYPAVAECDRPRHEVYVLTDLARSSWNPEQPAEGLDQRREGEDQARRQDRHLRAPAGARGGPRRRRSSRPSPPSSVATQGEPVEITGLVRAPGDQPAKRVVEFYLDGVKKGPEAVELPPTARSRSASRPRPSSRRASSTRASSGSAAAPTRWSSTTSRYFTFKVQPGPEGPGRLRPAIDAEFVAAALDPDPRRAGDPRPFQVERVRPAEFVGQLPRHAQGLRRVFLLNVEALDDAAWGLLNGYVHEGGGLVVGLGDRCRADELQRADRQPAPARARSAGDQPAKAGDDLRQDRRRHPPALPALSPRSSTPQLAAGPGLPLLGRQAARGAVAHPADLRRRRPGACSSGRSRGPRPAGSCSGHPAGPARQRERTAAPGTSSPCRRTGRSRT